MSTREPLRPRREPHPLLEPLHSLLAALNIPLSPSSLAIVTPSLLLTILEALLETRIEDVPDEIRGSWQREHRRTIVEVLVSAIDEVMEGLTRVLDERALRKSWRADEVNIEQVVRGSEKDVAVLVAGLLEIAEAMGVPAFEPSTELSQPRDLFSSPSETPRPHPLTSTIPPSAASSAFISTTTTPTPHKLFAPRALQPPRPRSAPLAVSLPSHRASSALSASTVSRTSTASARSADSRVSGSTSLTVPSHPSSSSSKSSTRPSLLSELAQSGVLSPPRSPRRRRRGSASTVGEDTTEEIRVRSTLSLLKRLTEEQEREQERKAKREKKKTEEQEREQELMVERRRRKSKGKELDQPAEEDPFTTERPIEGERTRCEDCGAAVRHSRRRSTETGDEASVESDAFSSSLPRSPSPSASSSCPSEREHSVHSGRRKPAHKAEHPIPPCSCRASRSSSRSHPPQPSLPQPHQRASTSTQPRTTTNAQAASASTLPRRRTRITRPADFSSSHPTHCPPLRSAPSTLSPLAQSELPQLPARSNHPRPRHLARTADDAGELSVHGESEIEAFERLHLGYLRSSSCARPPDHPRPPSAPHPVGPSTPSCHPASSSAAHPPQLDPSHEQEAPSPYTLMLLAQRDKLRQKLAVLERRERDRMEAADASVGGPGWAAAGEGRLGPGVEV
ncbi:hypothetical protein JCM8547_001402 [Rhodosporidiobolus lusitaniae]